MDYLAGNVQLVIAIFVLKNYEFVAILVCSYIMVKYAVCVNTYRRCMIKLNIFD